MPAKTRTLKGIPLSPGIASGPVYLMGHDEPELAHSSIMAGEVDREIARYEFALEEAKKQLLDLKAELERSHGDGPGAGIFGVHLLILEDPSYSTNIRERIEKRNLSAESAVADVSGEWERELLKLDDPIHRERVLDIRDLRNRLLRILLRREQEDLERGEGKFIVVARELLPSTAITLDTSRLLGIVTELGGAASHAAILARSFGIPAVSGIEGIGQLIGARTHLIIDGKEGVVLTNPSEEQVKVYQTRIQAYEEWTARIRQLEAGPAVTPDGIEIHLLMNVENFTSLSPQAMQACQGIGLYRTEFLFMGRDTFPSEEEQFQFYKSVLERLEGREVTFRTIDIGGDKPLKYLQTPDEENPVMGWRGIRMSFEWPDLFYTQIRALLRASRHGPTKIMLPMVSTIGEVREAKRIIDQLREDLREEEGDIEMPQLGVMIEVPSSAVCVDLIAEEVDFLSVGTNDLVQYVMAVDRNNLRVQNLYQPFNPAVIRLLKQVIETGVHSHTTVSVCGEMAGQPEALALLVGLGLRDLSMTPLQIPVVRRLVEKLPVEKAEEIAQQVLGLDTAEAVEACLEQHMRSLDTEIAPPRF